MFRPPEKRHLDPLADSGGHHHVRFLQGFDELEDPLNRVGAVAIGDDHAVVTRSPNACLEARAVADVGVVLDQPHAGGGGDQGGRVGRAVVDHYDLARPRGSVKHRLQVVHDLLEPPLFEWRAARPAHGSAGAWHHARRAAPRRRSHRPRRVRCRPRATRCPADHPVSCSAGDGPTPSAANAPPARRARPSAWSPGARRVRRFPPGSPGRRRRSYAGSRRHCPSGSPLSSASRRAASRFFGCTAITFSNCLRASARRPAASSASP